MKLEYTYTAPDGTKMAVYRTKNDILKTCPLYVWKQYQKKNKHVLSG